MKRKNTIFSKLYVVLCLAFFYLPILVTMIFSFNSSKSLTRFTGFSLRWYGELINNMEISKAVYVSVTVAILATVISTVLGTITAIGLSKSRKVLKEMVLTINNFPILNPEIVTAIGLMLLFSSLGMTKGYLTMLLAHIAFCTPYVITSVYPKVRSLDPNLANAAMDLGATPYQALTKVIVPMIKEGIFAGALLAFYYCDRGHCAGAAFCKSDHAEASGLHREKNGSEKKKDRCDCHSCCGCSGIGKVDDRKSGKPRASCI